MKTDQREILTRQKVYTKLRAANRLQSIHYCILCVLTGGIIALLAYGCTRMAMPIAILGIASIVFVSLLFLYYGYELIKHILQMQSGKFRVVEDKVIRIAENDVRTRTFWERMVRGHVFLHRKLLGAVVNRHAVEDVMYFRDAGRVVCSKTVCRCSNVDDIYYLVKYEGSNAVEQVYSAREYRFEEDI